MSCLTFVSVTVSLRKRLRLYFAVPAMALGVCTASAAQAGPAVSDVTDACVIFEERTNWLKAADRVSEARNVPVPVILAFIHRESRFAPHAAAKTSSAYGFAQAIDSTWSRYKQVAKARSADRSNFGDAADFIAWYMTLTKQRLDIPKDDIKGHYLAYHEGHGGYRTGDWTRKPALKKIARDVVRMAGLYEEQLLECGLMDYPMAVKNSPDPVQKPFGLENVVAFLPRLKPQDRQVAMLDIATSAAHGPRRRPRLLH